ncbi:MAG: FAD-dependent oxidoreductase [Pseudonocardiaceae bacterium]
MPPDAVVVGGGHHGLVTATVLADAGWDVRLLEATDRVGGAVRSAQLRAGYVTDLYSAFYPLTAVSPVLRSLRLQEHGLRSLFTAFPPVRGPAELLRTLGAAGALRLARFLALPADVPVDAPVSGVYRLATGDAGPRRRFPGAGR